MIEIRVHKDIEQVRVERNMDNVLIVAIPLNSSWKFLQEKLNGQLTAEELELAQKIWCEDEFPRVFNTFGQYVAIRPAL